MFPSPSCDNPIESLLKTPSFPSDQNPSPKQEDAPPFPFMSFPSPFFDENELPLNQIFFRNHHFTAEDADHQTPNNITHHPTKKNSKELNINGASKLDIQKVSDHPMRKLHLASEAVQRRKTGKKDRHSKIRTAQGIRDRRMRLSVQVARKFFDLQDMLGYDRASKTIEWLFTKSNNAIETLATTMDNPQENNKKISNITTKDAIKSESFLSACEDQYCEKDERETPKSSSCKPNTRGKARAKTRYRTREKLMIQKWYTNDGDCNIQKLGYSNSPFEGHVDNQESRSNDKEIRVSSSCFVDESSSLEQQFDDVGTIEKLLGYSSSKSTNSHSSAAVLSGNYIDFNSNNFMGLLGNYWDMLSNDRVDSTSIQYDVANQVSLAGYNPDSINLAASKFP